jgi:ABC-type sugar transport system ATPase subunit
MTLVASRDGDVILALANVESSYGPIKAIRGVSLKVKHP